jgi:hypothetical protein
MCGRLRLIDECAAALWLPDPSTDPPGHLIGMALMTDTDNTSTVWYGDVGLMG